MDQHKFNIQEELKKLPDKPGVYIMHDKKIIVWKVQAIIMAVWLQENQLFIAAIL